MKRVISFFLVFVLISVTLVPSIINANASTNTSKEQDEIRILAENKEEISTNTLLPIYIKVLQANWNKAKQKGKKVKDRHSKTQSKLPVKGDIYSSRDRVNKQGKVLQRRYYDGNGRVKTDIDYTNHGNPKTHPKVPHRHDWKWKKGSTKPERGKWY